MELIYIWQSIKLLSLEVCSNFVVFFLNDVEVEVVLITVKEAVDDVSDVG